MQATEAAAVQRSSPELHFTENPLILSRKQSDSASSLRAPGGSPTRPLKHISIREEPEQTAACLRAGSGAEGVIEGNNGTAGDEAVAAGPGSDASFGAQERGPGGPGGGVAGGTSGSGEPASNSGVRGQELGGTSGAAAGGPPEDGSVGGDTVSGDSDLAQTASTELGGIVIGVGPDPETPRAQSMVSASLYENLKLATLLCTVHWSLTVS